MQPLICHVDTIANFHAMVILQKTIDFVGIEAIPTNIIVLVLLGIHMAVL
jgi:hypothetical protein